MFVVYLIACAQTFSASDCRNPFHDPAIPKSGIWRAELRYDAAPYPARPDGLGSIPVTFATLPSPGYVCKDVFTKSGWEPFKHCLRKTFVGVPLLPSVYLARDDWRVF